MFNNLNDFIDALVELDVAEGAPVLIMIPRGVGIPSLVITVDDLLDIHTNALRGLPASSPLT